MKQRKEKENKMCLPYLGGNSKPGRNEYYHKVKAKMFALLRVKVILPTKIF